MGKFFQSLKTTLNILFKQFIIIKRYMYVQLFEEHFFFMQELLSFVKKENYFEKNKTPSTFLFDTL